MPAYSAVCTTISNLYSIRFLTGSQCKCCRTAVIDRRSSRRSCITTRAAVMSVFPLVPSCVRQLCPGDGSLMSSSALPRERLCLSFRWFPYVTFSFAQGMVMSIFPLVSLCHLQLCPRDGYVCLSVGSLISPSALPKGWLCLYVRWFPHVTVSFAQGMVMSVFPLVPLCHRQLYPRDGYVCLSVGSLMSPSALPKGWLCLSFRWFPYVTVSFAQGMVMSVFPLVPLCHRQLCPGDGYVCLSVGSLMSPSALPKGWLYLSFRWFPYVTVSFAQGMVMSVFPLVPLCHRQLCPGDGYVCLSVGSLMSPSALPKGWLCLSFRLFPHVSVSFAQGMVPSCLRQLCPGNGYVCLSVGSLKSPSALPKGWLCLSFRWFPYVTFSFAQGMVMSVFPLVPLCHRQLCPRDGYVCLSVGSLMSPSALPRRWMSVFPLVPLCHRQLCPGDGYVCLSVSSLMSPSALTMRWMSVFPLVPLCHRQLCPGDGYICLSVGSLMSLSILPMEWLCLSVRWFPYVTVSFAQEMVMSVFPLVPLCYRQLCPRDGYVCLSVGSLISQSALPRRWLCLSFRWFPYVTVSFAQGMVMCVFPLVPLYHSQLCPGDGCICLSVGSLMSP